MVIDENLHGLILTGARSRIWGGSDDLLFAAMPIAGKSLLQHRLDELRMLGVRKVTVLSDDEAELRAAVDPVALSGFDLRFAGSGQAAFEENEHVLLCSAEALAPLALDKIVASEPNVAMRARGGAWIGALLTGADANRAKLEQFSDISTLDMPVLDSTEDVHAVESVDDLLALNVAVLRGEIGVPRISGLEVAPNVHLEWMGSARPANVLGPVQIGEGAVIDPTARLCDTVIGRGASVSGPAILERCVVLADVTVPHGVRLRDAVVTENLVLFAGEEDGFEEFRGVAEGGKR